MMPQIEVLPSATTATKAPGWAYVPDTGFDPSKAPLVPSGERKRARASHVTSGSEAATTRRGDLTARQQTKIAKHLAELDKENHKDVQITIPSRAKDPSARGLRGKVTPAVKRILGSQKTFANHLADEEAAIANNQQTLLLEPPSAPPAQRSLPQPQPPKHTPTKPGRGRPGRPRRSSISRPTADTTPMEVDEPTASTQHPSADSHPNETQNEQNADDEALMKSHIPALPTDEEIEALLSAPPLSYSAARAAPTVSTAPPRLFCEICGYWGRAKCMRCGVRACGLECKTMHDETRCMKFYA